MSNFHNSSFQSSKNKRSSNQSNYNNSFDQSFNPYHNHQLNQSLHQNYHQNNLNGSRWDNNWYNGHNQEQYWNGNQSFGLANQMPRQHREIWNKQQKHNQTVSFAQGGWAQSGFYQNSSKQSSKKKKKNSNQSFASSSSSHPSQGPKIKLPTVKQDSSNEFYFLISTQTANHVVCPFNPQHIMQADRLLTHIGKCKLKSQNSEFYSVCPYEPCHYVYTSELQAHKLICDKRHLFVVSSWEQAGQGFRLQDSESAFTNTNDSNNLNNTVLQQEEGDHKGYPVSIPPQKTQYQNFLLQP